MLQIADDRHQPRQRLSPRRGVRVRRRLELRVQGAGGARAALSRSRTRRASGACRSTCTIGGVEMPIGLALITVVLFAVAVINLFTKQMATISGVVVHAGAVRRCSSCPSGHDGAPGGRHVGQARSVPAAAARPTSASSRCTPAGQRAGAGARLQHARAPRLGARRHATPSSATSS